MKKKKQGFPYSVFIMERESKYCDVKKHGVRKNGIVETSNREAIWILFAFS